ncbi:hypothetical protein GC722_02980 [Auraticoccus sp. F435]|uniref:DNA primase n=1 Tax=Auraticoccus cholistanensis TaxID=2656650 RepID=A0A6A9UQ21_9ACTN|nr:hypothetical protein [Auraticoccus cholistanensis]MVA74996.1 hypothetical protein [Auraticoccus cholistanensis]
MSLSLILRAALAALALVLMTTAVSNCGAEAPVPGQQQPAEDGDEDGSNQGGDDEGDEGDEGDDD